MKRLIRVSGFVIDYCDAFLDAFRRVAEDDSARHWHIDVGEVFEEDPEIEDKNCDLAKLERHFIEHEYVIDESRKLPKRGEQWRHFKGKVVTVIQVAKHSEDPTRKFVVYDCPNGTYVRPLDMFMSEVDTFKYPNVTQKYRFEYIGDKSSELVNHPAHYNAPGRKECIEEMIDIWGEEQTAIWCEMTAYKYDYRAGTKEGEPDERDMSKRRWYLNKAKELRAEPHENRPVAASTAEGEFTPSDAERTASTWQEKLMKAFLKGTGK